MIRNPCPKCGAELEQGYGLAGGGMGPYEFCPKDGCDYFTKSQDPEMEQVAAPRGNTMNIPVKTDIMESVIVKGDLAKLTPDERVRYYGAVCESVGLNPLTKPFEYITLNNKLTLYALRNCTDQLRTIHGVSVDELTEAQHDGVYVVTAKVRNRDGRTDIAKGAVAIANLKGEVLANAMMKAECVPLDSEILTRDGFKRHDQLSIGEDVLAYDCGSDKTLWTPLLEVTRFPSSPVVSMQSTKGQFAVICTADHSWAVTGIDYAQRSTGARPLRGPYANRQPLRRLVKASQIKTSHKIILAAPESNDEESLLSPTEAAILGWAVTDGTIQRRGSFVRIGVCQSKEENFDAIREIVGDVKELVSPARARTFPMSGKTYETLPQHWWYLPAEVSRSLLKKAGFISRADLPRIATRLDNRARAAMLQAMMLAEGDKRNRFANGDPSILEAFEILCALQGKATGKTTPKDTIWTKRLKTTRHVAGNFLSLEDAGEMSVWCPTTAFGTWVMRQNGRVMITGNTKAKRRATLSLCGLGFLDETEVADVPITHRRPPPPAPNAMLPHDPETGEVSPPAPNNAMAEQAAPSDNETHADGAALSFEDMAREAAMRGEAVFKAFYKSRNAKERERLNAMGDELRGLMT